MDASVLGATDPAVKYDQHSSIPRQFQDVHSALLRLPDYRPVAQAASRQAHIEGTLGVAGNTFHDPSSCRKKKIAKEPVGRNASARTQRLWFEPARP
jgi:hypothetical protein